MFICIFIFLFKTVVFSQGGVNKPGFYPGREFSAMDCFNKARYKQGSFKDSVMGNEVLHGQRVWRVVSLDDQQNKMLFNTTKGCAQVGLFEVMKFGLLEMQLNAFDADDFNEAAKYRLTGNQKIARLQTKDSSEVVIFDDKGDEKKETVVNVRFYMGSDIKSFLLKEDWLMNAKTGETEMRIIGIAPLVQNPKTEGVYPLFWLYYPEWKNLLASFMAKSAFDDEPRPYAEIFAKRKFVSQINKESNVHGRSVRSIHHGEDIKLKTEEIKDRMNNKESDHFGQ
jgi:hypothetical protein